MLSCCLLETPPLWSCREFRDSRVAIALARHKGAYWEIPGSALGSAPGVLWEIGVLWGVLPRVLRESGGGCSRECS